jgi:hypothetical protein
MRTRSTRFVVLTLAALAASVVTLTAAGAQRATRDPVANLVVGTWRLDLSRSKYFPGPPPKSETRTYEADGDFIKATIHRVDAAGNAETVSYTANYDNPYPVTGSENYDAIKMTRIDPYTSESVLSHAGRVFGIARRVISPDGKTMTITLRREGEVLTNNVAHYEKMP